MFDGGSLARISFTEKGVVLVDVEQKETKATINPDQYLDTAIEVGAEEVSLEEDEEGQKVLQVISGKLYLYHYIWR